MDAFPSPNRPASSLDDACNDTGRTAFCGPYVVAAITGYPISKIEDVIRDARNSRRKTVVKGTGADEVEAALAAFGYTMTLKENFMNRPFCFTRCSPTRRLIKRLASCRTMQSFVSLQTHGSARRAA